MANFGVVDLKGLNLEEISREMGEERAVEMINIIIKNNTKILGL